MADNQQPQNVQRLAQLIKGIKCAMLTTTEDDGSLRSRPMATQQSEFDGDLWFFTSDESGKVKEVEQDRHVNIAYASPTDNRYVSVSGLAKVIHDRRKAQELWREEYKSWFPQGLDDPHLSLLKVKVQKAEFWDTPSGSVVNVEVSS